MKVCNYCSKMIVECRICSQCGGVFCNDSSCIYTHGCDHHSSIDRILDMIETLQQEDRELLFREKITEKFCFYCGSDDPDCKCYKV